MSTSAADIANRPLVICGMHRSGTSLTASLFGGAGVHLGDHLLGCDANNPPGHFEDVGILEFHRHALRVLGHNLEGYVTRPLADLPVELEAEARELIAERIQTPRFWGWKEPRTALFLDFWDRLLPNACYAFVFRKPWDVVDSLFRRGDAAFVVDPRLALDVWLTYNRSIAEFITRHPTKCVLFEISQLIADPPGTFAAVRTQLNLPLGEPPDRFQHNLFGRECNPHGADVVRCQMPEAYDLYEHLRWHAIGGPNVPIQDAPATRPAADQVDPAALARYTLEEWARASRATMRERKLLAEVSAAAERETRLTADMAAATADRDRLAAQLAAATGEHQRLAHALEQVERERDWRVHEKLQLATESERLALALAEATSGPLHRLAGWFQGRSSTGRAA